MEAGRLLREPRRLSPMWTNPIQPKFDPTCRRVFHADRQGAQAQLVALEVWNRATGKDLRGRRLVVYQCPRCGGYHVAARFAPPPKRRFAAAVAAEGADVLSADAGDEADVD